jgi:hypothetical protein
MNRRQKATRITVVPVTSNQSAYEASPSMVRGILLPLASSFEDLIQDIRTAFNLAENAEVVIYLRDGGRILSGSGFELIEKNDTIEFEVIYPGNLLS